LLQRSLSVSRGSTTLAGEARIGEEKRAGSCPAPGVGARCYILTVQPILEISQGTASAARSK
jgi:hypothetical protein